MRGEGAPTSGAPPSGAIYGPRNLAKKRKGKPWGVSPSPGKRKECRCREVDGGVRRRRCSAFAENAEGVRPRASGFHEQVQRRAMKLGKRSVQTEGHRRQEKIRWRATSPAVVSGSNPATEEAVVENYRLGELPCVEAKPRRWFSGVGARRCGVAGAEQSFCAGRSNVAAAATVGGGTWRGG